MRLIHDFVTNSAKLPIIAKRGNVNSPNPGLVVFIGDEARR